MYSKVKIAGHPVHPMLVAYPVAFYTATVVCYIVYSNNHDVFWFKVGYVANAAGLIMAVLAALTGFIDWLNIPSNVRAKKVGLYHMICNVIALLLFGICFLQQKNKWMDPQPELGAAIILSVLGFAVTLIAGFLGWALVQKHHVGVDEYREENKATTVTR
jgi:uncharacterized membrane protein